MPNSTKAYLEKVLMVLCGYSRTQNDVFVVPKRLSVQPYPGMKVSTKLSPLSQLARREWKQLFNLQGRFPVLYLRSRYGSPATRILLAHVERKLAHVGWIVPGRKVRGRYPFVPEDSYAIISCLTLPRFRGLSIYPSQIREVAESEIPAKAFWIWTPSDNVASLKGIRKAGGVKVGECIQKKWLWGFISRIEYFPEGEGASERASGCSIGLLDEPRPMNVQAFQFRDDYWTPRCSKKLLTYTGPALEGNLELEPVQAFVRKRGAWGAMWNYDHDCAEQGPWYRCICDNANYDESAIKSKNARHNLRRGLKRCVTRRVDYAWLADNGYDVYVKAAARYKNFKVESRGEFTERMRSHAGQPAAEALGVFVGDKLVAYVTLFICGQSVRGDTAHFDPSYANCYPMYALYYTIAHHYLRERGFKEVDRGSRPLVHETNVDDFLLRLGYRKAYCRLGIYLVGPVRIVLALARFCRRLYKLILPCRYAAALEGLLQAQDIARATSVQPDRT